MTTAAIIDHSATEPASIESRASWIVAATALGVGTVAFGAPGIAVVGLKPIAAELGGARSVPALAYSLAWLGAGVGGVAMGWAAERIGVRWTVMFGIVMSALGLVISTEGSAAALYIGHGLFIGLIGNAGIQAPLYVYVSRWFDRRRGTAVALISCGQYAAGTVWATLFERGIATIGWRQTMLYYAVFEIAMVVPAAALVLRAPPDGADSRLAQGPIRGALVLGLRPRSVQILLCAAGFCCCVPMAMPQGHLVALCSDLGISAAHGAAMLSVLLACAILSRLFWGTIADRLGGLRTVLLGTAWQMTAMVGFLLTQDEAGLFAVAALFGLGFGGIIPAYVIAFRDLYPVAEASWRIPTFLLFSGSGMAAGGWLAGIIYDAAGFYAAAFAVGIAFNFVNIAIISGLVLRRGQVLRPRLAGG